ncbi:MAG: TIGR04255 family protein [Candidatus Obscuribacter sp.]|nr:TIGR04255 family protein [Candidatus Obscuribacter sp.]
MNIHYQKPPIIEAIMDFVVTPMVPLEPDQLMAFAQTQSKDYADQSPVSEFTLNIDGQNLGTPTTPSMKVVSYIARDHDENRAFQVRSTGFSYSKLAPYDCWESFFNEGKRIWNLYSNFSNPKSIDRVAVRFINRLDIPLPITDFKDWLQTVPDRARLTTVPHQYDAAISKPARRFESALKSDRSYCATFVNR